MTRNSAGLPRKRMKQFEAKILRKYIFIYLFVVIITIKLI